MLRASGRADGNHQVAMVGQLIDQCAGNGGGCGSDCDRVVGRVLRPAPVTIALGDCNVGETQLGDAMAGSVGEFGGGVQRRTPSGQCETSPPLHSQSLYQYREPGRLR